MANSKEIRRRIGSIKNTQKMTRAMEMISAVKMRKATERVAGIRPYAHTAHRVLANMARSFARLPHPLLKIRSVKKVLLIIVASDRGLCGAFNAQISRALGDAVNNSENLRAHRTAAKIALPKSEGALSVEAIVVGKKAAKIARRFKIPVVAAFENLGHLPALDAVRPIAKIAIDDYAAAKYDKIALVYTDFISPLVQQAKVRQLIPISPPDIEKQIAEMDAAGKEYVLTAPNFEYTVEPSPESVLDELLPSLIRMQIYHALLESSASQESARMAAMRNASDSAGEISEELTLTYNQIRQTKITQEISEISAGMAAVS